ncbi:MAG TPA: KTSC domain-containing protein [Candidatus Saccharimonadales bacterium]|nr:KTSC domain-containing protein [Candidatus Saccharimonadales bacterium]
MERTPVSSSNIESVGYDAATRTLEVEFLSGSIYQYSNVSAEKFSGLMSAWSKGDYLNYWIKEGGYSYKQVY